MKTTQIEAAEPIGLDEPSEVTITISKRNSLRARSSVGELIAMFELDAENLAGALFDSLPGGTLDRLLAIMLKRKASSLIVSHHDLGVLR